MTRIWGFVALRTYVCLFFFFDDDELDMDQSVNANEASENAYIFSLYQQIPGCVYPFTHPLVGQWASQSRFH